MVRNMSLKWCPSGGLNDPRRYPWQRLEQASSGRGGFRALDWQATKRCSCRCPSAASPRKAGSVSGRGEDEYPLAMHITGLPNRWLIIRRWVGRAAILGAFLAAWYLCLDYYERGQLEEWASVARSRGLTVAPHRTPLLSVFRDNPVVVQWCGRNEVIVSLLNDADLDALLGLQRCPVRLRVAAGPVVTEEARRKVRLHLRINVEEQSSIAAPVVLAE